MGAGRLRHRITLQKRTMTENAYGEAVESWVDDVTLWASVEALRGREFFERGSGSIPQTQAEVDTRIRIRYRAGMNPAEHRIVYGGTVYDLVAVLPDRKRAFIELMVKMESLQQ